MKMRILVCGLGVIIAACDSRVDPPPAPVNKPTGKVTPAAKPAETPVDEAIKAPATRITDPDPATRLDALAKIVSSPEPKRSLPELVAALQNEDEAVRQTAELALQTLGPDIVPEMVKQFHHPRAGRHAFAVLGRLGPDARAALPDLLALFRKDPELGPMAVSVMRKIGRPAVSAILEDFAQGDRRRKSNLLMLLSGFGASAEEAIPTIEKYLEDPELGRTAKYAMDKIRPQMTPFRDLVAGLSSKDPAVRSQSARDLMVLGPKVVEALPELVEAFREAPTDRDVREALKRCGDRAYMPLLPFLRSENETLVESTYHLLNFYSKVPPEAVPELLAIVKIPRLQRWGFQLLPKHGAAGAAAIADAVAVRESPDPHVNRAATAFLNRVCTPKAIPVLAKMLQSADGNERRDGAFALHHLRNFASTAEPQIRAALQDERQDVRSFAEQILKYLEEDAKK